jgi:ketosteroid isomerase-like protein
MTVTGRNGQLVRRFYEAVGGDVTEAFSGEDMMRVGEVLVDIVTEDFECVMVGPFEKYRYEGLVGFAEAWRDWVEPYSSFFIDVEEMEERDDAVLMLVRQRATTRRDAVQLEDTSAALWRFRDGRLSGAEFYLDRDAAREAFERGQTP